MHFTYAQVYSSTNRQRFDKERASKKKFMKMKNARKKQLTTSISVLDIGLDGRLMVSSKNF